MPGDKSTNLVGGSKSGVASNDKSRSKSGSKSGSQSGSKNGSKNGSKSGSKSEAIKQKKSENNFSTGADHVHAIRLSSAGSRAGTSQELWRLENLSGTRKEASPPDPSERQHRKQKDDRSLKGILKSSPCKEPASRCSSGKSGFIPDVNGSSTTKTAERVTRFRPPSALRKSQSVSDVRRTSLDFSCGFRNRRMSTSHVAHEASRRSSMASITISLSRPDSLDSHILYEPEDELPFELHPVIPELGTNTTTDANQESGRSFLRNSPRSFVRRWSSTGHLKSARNIRRNSCPGAVNHVWKISASALSGTPAKTKASSPRNHLPPISPRSSGVFLPASRPSSILNGISPSKKSSISQIGCISRPWTPSTVSPSSGSRSWSVHRNPYHSRTTVSMVAPLQMLNAKVRNILGCTTNILDFYGKQPDADPNRNRIRATRITQSVKMNRKNIEPAVQAPKIIHTRSKKEAKRIQRPPSATTNQRKSTKKPTKPQLYPTPQSVPSVPSKPEAPKPEAPKPEAPKPETTKPAQAVHQVAAIAPHAMAPEDSAPGDSAPGDSAPSASVPITPAVANLIKVKWKALASSGVKVAKQSVSEPAKLATPWKTVKVPRMRKSGGANSGGGGGGGTTIDPVVSSLVQTLIRQRNDRSKRNRNNGGAGGGGGGGGNGFIPLCKLEQYTDKDRAAAVLLGDTDIKTTLEKQMKSERGRYVMPKESSAQVYLVQADFEMRIGGLGTAHRLLDKVYI